LSDTFITSTDQPKSRFKRRRRPRRRRGPVANALEILVTVVVAIGLALLIQAFVVKPYKIPSGSMIPTLSIGQRILVNRLDRHPGLGQIVVFHPPVGAEDFGHECGDTQQGPDSGGTQACDKAVPEEWTSETFVKRVVGLPGDHLKIIRGIVYRNGKPEKLAYTTPQADAAFGYVSCDNTSTNGECNLPKPITVPAGEYYMMGDNRGNSDDSRYWGPVPQKWIIGEAFATYWPIDKIGIF
jgi:signal peptidase I